MNDDLERRVRDALRTAPLPQAPQALRAHLARLPVEAGPPPTLRRRPFRRMLPLLAGIVLIGVVSLIGLSALFGAATPVPTSVPSVSAATSAAVPTGGPSPSSSTNAAGPVASEAGTFVTWDKGSAGFWVVRDSTLLVSVDGGATWSAGAVPSSPTALHPPNALLDVFDASHVWALTEDDFGTGVSGDITRDKLALTVHRSTDGGRTWADIPISGNYPGSLQALHFLDASHGYLLISPGRMDIQTSTLLRTTDGGLTWQVAGSDGWLGTELATPDASTIWAASAGDAGPVERRIFAVSGDSGRTWRDVALPGVPSATGQAAYFLQPPVFIPLPRGVFIGTPRGVALVAHNDGSGIADIDRSDDFGKSWTRVSTTTASSLAVRSYTSWLRPGIEPGTIEATDNAGLTWQPLAVAGLPAAPITWIGFADASHGALLAASGDAYSSGLYVTSDSGSTWRPADLTATSVTRATPEPTEVASPSPVPSSEQTCSASQFVLGKATSTYGFGTFGMTSVYVTQPLRNGGGNCVLHLPATIRVASATGPFQTVTVVNAGTASSFSIQSGQSLSIVLGAWWHIPGLPSGTGIPATQCTGAISDVSRVEIPLASSSIQIDLGTVWHEVCSSPASVSLTVSP